VRERLVPVETKLKREIEQLRKELSYSEQARGLLIRNYKAWENLYYQTAEKLRQAGMER
jgi:hypothetical protein